MPRLDYSLLPFTVHIGAFEVTNYIDSLKLSAPKSDLGKHLSWVGDFDLAFTYDAEIAGLTHADFDPLQTPTRWRPGVSVATITIAGYTLPKMRIRKYTYNEQTRQGRADLHQILDLVAGDRPAVEIETTIGKDGTPLEEATSKLIEAAFAGATITPTVSIGTLTPTGYLDDRLTTRDPMSDAQKLVGSCYAWLHVDSSEAIRAVDGDPQKRPIAFVRSIGQVEWDPDHDGIDFAAEKVIVTGSRKTPAPGSTVIKVLNSAQEQSHDDEGRQIKLVVPTYKKVADLYPDVFRDENGLPTSTASVLAELKTTEYHYWGIGQNFETLPAIDVDGSLEFFPDLAGLGYEAGELVETVTITQKTRGEIYADLHPGDTSLVEAEKLVERDYAKIQYLTRGEVNPDGYPGDTTLTVAKAEAIKSGRVEPDGAVRNQKGKGGKPLELEPRYKREYSYTAADIPMVTENLKGECDIAPANWVPFRNNPLVEDAGFIPSQAHADNLARQIAYREVRFRDAINITMPMPLEWLAAGCPPLARCHIHNAELQIEIPVIVMAAEKLSFSFTGARIGTIPTIPDPPPTPPYIPTTGLQILPAAAMRAIAGVAISQQLTAIGGTPAYTWVAVSALPAGLGLSSGGLLSGTVAGAVAGANYTVRVTDSVSATVTATIWIEAIALAPAIPPVIERSGFDLEITAEVEFSSSSLDLIPFEVPVVAEVEFFSGVPSDAIGSGNALLGVGNFVLGAI